MDSAQIPTWWKSALWVYRLDLTEVRISNLHINSYSVPRRINTVRDYLIKIFVRSILSQVDLICGDANLFANGQFLLTRAETSLVEWLVNFLTRFVLNTSDIRTNGTGFPTTYQHPPLQLHCGQLSIQKSSRILTAWFVFHFSTTNKKRQLIVLNAFHLILIFLIIVILILSGRNNCHLTAYTSNLPIKHGTHLWFAVLMHIVSKTNEHVLTNHTRSAWLEKRNMVIDQANQADIPAVARATKGSYQWKQFFSGWYGWLIDCSFTDIPVCCALFKKWPRRWSRYTGGVVLCACEVVRSHSLN